MFKKRLDNQDCCRRNYNPGMRRVLLIQYLRALWNLAWWDNVEKCLEPLQCVSPIVMAHLVPRLFDMGRHFPGESQRASTPLKDQLCTALPKHSGPCSRISVGTYQQASVTFQNCCISSLEHRGTAATLHRWSQEIDKLFPIAKEVFSCIRRGAQLQIKSTASGKLQAQLLFLTVVDGDLDKLQGKQPGEL